MEKMGGLFALVNAVTAVDTNGDASWTDEGLMVAALRCETDVCPADAVDMPYEYAQLTRIDFLTSTSSREQDGRMIDLATVSFTDAGGGPSFDSDWTLVATPRFERVKPNWRVALPEQVAVGLQARLRQLPRQTTVDRPQPADSAESQPGG